jgi:hypothetical protein
MMAKRLESEHLFVDNANELVREILRQQALLMWLLSVKYKEKIRRYL